MFVYIILLAALTLVHDLVSSPLKKDRVQGWKIISVIAFAITTFIFAAYYESPEKIRVKEKTKQEIEQWWEQNIHKKDTLK